MIDKVAISVNNVSKNFKLPHERADSIKSLFVNPFDKKRKKFEIQHALKDISFEIKKGEFFGIVGRNGSGKSTLLKIIAGIYQPNSGSVNIDGRLVPFIELGVGFNSELTGRENVYLSGALSGFSAREMDEMYDDIVSFAELGSFMDQKLKNYSSGMQVRLAFSVATRSKADVLLIDEVLAVGDAEFQRKCFKYFKDLKKSGKTVVFVSHDMGAVREYCDRAVLIEDSEIIKQGDVCDVATAYTKMFMSDDSSSVSDKISKKRWGDRDVVFKDVNISKDKYEASDGYIELKVKYEANKAVDNTVFGMSIKNTDGTVIMGTNTRLQNLKIDHIKKGKYGVVEWRVLNIFNDGDYIIDIAVVAEDGTPYDWWEDAGLFSVYREQHTPYAVEPPVEVVVG